MIMEQLCFTETELKAGLDLYAKRLCLYDKDQQPEHVFSEWYNSRIASILKKDKARQNRRKVLRAVASFLIILALSFSMIMAFSSRARAYFADWIVDTYDKLVEFTINHTGDDHAVIICAPESLPEGFERVKTQRDGYYSNTLYSNAETGDYIRFEYRKATDAWIKTIARRAEKAELVPEDGPIKKYFTVSASENRLFWYDPDRALVFTVRSSLGKETLVDIFSRLSYRLPMYEPTWLPEGVKVMYVQDVYPQKIIVYGNDKFEDVLYIIIQDMAESAGVVIDRLGDGIIQYDVEFSEKHCYVYPASEHSMANELICVDENNNLIVTMNGILSESDLLKMIESAEITETDW